MARPIAAEKLGYYPAHPRAVRWIAQKIRADPRAVLVDPCGGEGSAVALLAADHLNGLVVADGQCFNHI